jgi:hypothetical protein
VTTAEFKTKWAKFSGKESAVYQEPFSDRCRMLGVPTPVQGNSVHFRGAFVGIIQRAAFYPQTQRVVQ